jgi:UDP-N-acetylglucosamine--N-acetylmuramyl-(pentapeptide) pyrophosphoryl-undecaprenol N-acetylglucosamine transferase
MSEKVVLLSAGGTGGHLFPAEALAHELNARGWTVDLASDPRAERFTGKFPARKIHPIASATIGSKNPVALARSFWTLWRGFRQSSAVIASVKPQVVVGFGGYPTLPPLYAATRRGVPSLIHEQNAVMGRANKALAERVNAIAGGFLSEVAGPLMPKLVVTGNPVRPAVIEAAETAYVPSGPHEPFRLLMFGGSQGAQFFSQAMPPAIAALPEHLRKRLVVTQQARQEEEEAVRKAYADLGISAEVSPFFSDMASRMAAAHLVISRSGASTVSEAAAIGRPAIFVPYPHALDHDQAANAAAMEKAGGALVRRQSDLSTAALAALIEELMADPDRLAGMAQAARVAGRPEAVKLLADLTEAIASGMPVQTFKEGARP